MKRGSFFSTCALAQCGHGSKPTGAHFGIGAPPILVYFSWDWDVHWGYGVLTHGPCLSGSPREVLTSRVSTSEPTRHSEWEFVQFHDGLAVARECNSGPQLGLRRFPSLNWDELILVLGS